MKKNFLFMLLALSAIQPLFAQVPSYVPTNGLVGYWPFNGNANDESGNGNNGTNNGATLISDRFGNVNSAYSFDGLDDSIHIGQINLTSNYSISFWSNLSNSEFQYPIGLGINQTNTADIYKGYGIGYSSSTPPCSGVTSSKYFVFDAVSTCNNFLESNNIISPSQWNQVVITKNGNLVSININGILENSRANMNIQGILDLYFGVRTDLFAFFNGKLDDIGIWNRALTPQEITNLYNSVNSNECLTMVINSGPLSTNPVTYASTVNIFPNPANDQITIDCGNLANVVGWNIKITNALGQQVFAAPMNTQQYVVPLNSWSGQGMYFVKILNAQNEVVNIKKIILQ